ncbi:MAG TPA: DUF2156 domain-containing protein [Clostridiales bacterium]|nr:DUF2156 domain-containing protein [Clostridiales bacterium]
MDSFHIPQLSDIDWVEDIVKNTNVINCSAPFGTNYVWRKAYGTQICHYNDMLLSSYTYNKDYLYFDFPVGNGDTEKALHYILAYGKKFNRKTTIFCSGEEQANFIKQLYPHHFEIDNIRDSAEYIYLAEDLAYLKGRKFHSKKNHINKFTQKYNWSYEPINSTNVSDALEVAKIWCQAHGIHGTQGLSSESCAIRSTFKHFEQLRFKGGLIRIDDKPVAMAVGEEITPDCFVVHFEKAVDGYDGLLYAAINNGFSSKLLSYKYINREEDLGIEGLRKAKLSYHPAILLEKYSFTLK